MEFVKILLVLLFTIIFTQASAQMPEWKYFKDREGNGYYLDGAYKIHITDTISKDYRPVSLKGVSYFYNLALELISSHRVKDSVYYLKAINALKSDNNRILSIQKQATMEIRNLIAKHGRRYELYSRDNCILINSTDSGYRIINDSMKYRFWVYDRPFLIKKRWKYRGTAHSVKFGMGRSEDVAFDYLLGIESRRYRFNLRDLGEAMNSIITEMAISKLNRKVISRGEKFHINSFSYGAGGPFSGVEGFFIEGNRFIYVRTMCHDNLKGSLLPKMESIVKSFRIQNR